MFGVAVRATVVVALKEALQVPGQEIPTGAEVTVPLPLPAVATLRGKLRVKAPANLNTTPPPAEPAEVVVPYRAPSLPWRRPAQGEYPSENVSNERRTVKPVPSGLRPKR